MMTKCPHCNQYDLPDETYKECHNCWEVHTRIGLYPNEVEDMKAELEAANLTIEHLRGKKPAIDLEDHHFVPFKDRDDLLGSCSIPGCVRTDAH